MGTQAHGPLAACPETMAQDVCGQDHSKCPRDLILICSAGSPETHKDSEEDRAPQRPSKERAGCFGGRQKTSLASRTRAPGPPPKLGGLSPGHRSAAQPLLAASWGASKTTQAAGSRGAEMVHRASPLGRVQALLQLQMAATRWRRRVQCGQLQPRVQLVGCGG